MAEEPLPRARRPPGQARRRGQRAAHSASGRIVDRAKIHRRNFDQSRKGFRRTGLRQLRAGRHNGGLLPAPARNLERRFQDPGPADGGVPGRDREGGAGLCRVRHLPLKPSTVKQEGKQKGQERQEQQKTFAVLALLAPFASQASLLQKGDYLPPSIPNTSPVMNPASSD